MHMYGKKSAFNCAESESLVVIMSFPLCDIVGEQDGPAPLLPLEMAIQDESNVFDSCDGALIEGCALPFRCACLMNCSDAIALMQEVGDVVF